MARRRHPRKRTPRAARPRRASGRLTGVAGVVVGAMLAVGGGLLYAATRPASPALPVRAAGAASSTAPHRPATSMPFGGPATPDPAVRDGRLEIPLVDSIELLPGCHH